MFFPPWTHSVQTIPHVLKTGYLVLNIVYYFLERRTFLKLLDYVFKGSGRIHRKQGSQKKQSSNQRGKSLPWLCSQMFQESLSLMVWEENLSPWVSRSSFLDGCIDWVVLLPSVTGLILGCKGEAFLNFTRLRGMLEC